MTDQSAKPFNLVLDPTARLSQALFGLIMALTFTGTISVAESGHDDMRAMLIGALASTLVWGIIDGLFFLMGSLGKKGRGIQALLAVRRAQAPEEAHRVIAGELPPVVAAILGPAEYESLHQKLLQLPEPPAHPGLDKEDLLRAVGVTLWVVLATFPISIPFMFMTHVEHAMRVSNGIAIVLLFLNGMAFGRLAGYRPWRTGLAMVMFGTVLVAFTIALGG
jgi:VIT1/CCC1 family predicted Fe2+/Mn2+ transporter